jgi:hypothetical protein
MRLASGMIACNTMPVHYFMRIENITGAEVGASRSSDLPMHRLLHRIIAKFEGFKRLTEVRRSRVCWTGDHAQLGR